MLRIIYDHQVFAWQKYGGISRYYYELAKRVANADGFTASIVAPFHINDYLLKGGVKVKGMHLTHIPETERTIYRANRLLAPALIRASSPDVVHETYYQHRSNTRRRLPSVVTVHDMIHEKFASTLPALDRTSSAKRAAVARADFVICVSDNTRRDLIDLFGVSPEKTKVIHLGFALADHDSPAVLPSLPIKPFILYVGQRRYYKNFDALLTAFASSKKLSTEFCLLAFGGGGFTQEEEDKIRKLKLPKTAVHQVHGPDAFLAMLYKQAVAFVYPSLYEGFGIPPLEAMSFDCPVLCSNTSSIPEIVGDAAYLFDPNSIDEIRAGMEAVLESTDARKELVRRGRERIRFFSWDHCATETMHIYRRLAQSIKH